MNKVILMGRLTQDPEIRYSNQQNAVCQYTLAVNRSYKRDGETEADFIKCVAFGKRGEFAGKYFTKGQMVAVVGELHIESYTDREGTRRLSTSVIVSEQHFTGGKKESSRSSEEGAERYEERLGIDDFEEDFSDEDIPF